MQIINFNKKPMKSCKYVPSKHSSLYANRLYKMGTGDPISVFANGIQQKDLLHQPFSHEKTGHGILIPCSGSLSVVHARTSMFVATIRKYFPLSFLKSFCLLLFSKFEGVAMQWITFSCREWDMWCRLIWSGGGSKGGGGVLIWFFSFMA